MRYTAYIFESMALPERLPAAEFYPQEAAERPEHHDWTVWEAPVLVAIWEGVTFIFGSFKGEIGLADGTIVPVRNLDDEAVKVCPEGLLLSDSTSFPEGSFEWTQSWLGHSVFFEFAP